MYSLNALLAAAVMVAVVNQSHAQDSDVIVAQYNFFKQNDRISFEEKTLKELNTPEGKAIVGAVAGWVGADPKTINLAVGLLAPKVTQTKQGEDYGGFFASPPGYTVCSARPSNPNMGSGHLGIETHNSTFNTTIVRAYKGKSDDGLGYYANLPRSRSKDHRIAAPFEITFVKKGAEARFKCQKTGDHPWLATNNGTRLNVQCDPKAEAAYCPGN